MGRIITPKYRLKYKYICFREKRRKTAQMAWNSKDWGRPTVDNLIKWRKTFNQSLIDGCNSHLNQLQSGASKTWIELNTPDGRTICEYNPPMFEVV